MKTLAATLALVAVLVVGAILLTGGPSDRRSTRPSSPASVGSRPVPAPRFSAKQINRQRQPDARRRRAEARVFDRRPLLNALPTTLHGVSFEIAGLAADGRTTVIGADARGRGQRRARIAYGTLRQRTGDRSGAYRLLIKP